MRSNLATRVNLAERPDNYDYYTTAVSDISNIYDLTFFAFLDELANNDIKTTPDFIDKYFTGLFSSDPEDDFSVRADIRGHFGIIGRTKWGRIVTHITKVVDLAIKIQCTVKLHYHGDVYLGTHILGSNYIITLHDGKLVTSHPQQLVADSMATFFPHTRAFTEILAIVTTLGKDEDWLMETIKISSGNYCMEIESLNTTEDQRKRIFDLSQELSFEMPYDHVTVGNVLDCLSYIADESKPFNIRMPRHPVSLFNPSRIFKALARFGKYAPSFRVRGGRIMSLSSNFVVEVQQPMRGGGTRKVTKNVGRIGAALRPIKEAVADFEEVVASKNVINPFGNAVTRASSTSIVKVYEGNDCMAVVTALRSICKISLADENASNKRKNDSVDAGSSKRTKGMSDL